MSTSQILETGGITPLGPFGEGELLIILLIIFIIVGPGKLPQLVRALGEALREFKKAASGEYEEEKREREARRE